MRPRRLDRRRIWRVWLPLLFLALLFPVLPTTAVQAATRCVNPSGTGGCFVTIQAAVNASASGDTVTVAVGTWDEAVTINASLTLIGAGPGLTILDHKSQPNGCACITINSGTVSISGFTITRGGNTTAIANSGQTTVTNSVLSGNVAGVGNGAGGTMTVINSTMSGNGLGTSNVNGGTLTVMMSTIQQNTGTGVYNDHGNTMMVTGTTITGNGSPNHSGGGGVTNFGTLNITASTIIGNTASNGGGIQNWGMLSVLNSTITGNTAPASPPPPDRPGPGISNFGGTAILTHTTISYNTVMGVPYPQALYTVGGSVVISNSILANPYGDCFPNPVIASGDYNVTLTPCFTTPQPYDVVADPRLGGLQNAGGPTQTEAIGPGSPALDAIPIGNPHCPATDQRGVARPQGAGCDSGAYEYVPPPPRPAPAPRPALPPNGTPPPPLPAGRPGVPTMIAMPNPVPPHR